MALFAKATIVFGWELVKGDIHPNCEIMNLQDHTNLPSFVKQNSTQTMSLPNVCIAANLETKSNLIRNKIGESPMATKSG